MVRNTHCCNLCGFAVRAVRPRTAPFTWLNEFRAVISSSGGGGVALTGVGINIDADAGSYKAPRDANTHWIRSGFVPDKNAEFGVGTQFENGRYGFLFHNSCWCVLERAFHPEPVPLGRLYEVCLSMPRPLEASCISWGHDYGGLQYWKRKPCYPWGGVEEPGACGMDDLEDSEPGESEASRQWAERYGQPPPRGYVFDGDDEWTQPTVRASIVTSDPYHSHEIHMILQEQPESPPVRLVLDLPPHATVDRLSQLPHELRAAIAAHLPTTDFLSGRLALRGLWDIFDSQQFWATRFLGRAAERSWVFDSHIRPDCTRDWRSLFRQTSDFHLSQSGPTRNRRRVWGLALRLTSILSLEPLARIPPPQDEKGGGNREWTAAHADICNPPPEEPHKAFIRGCRLLHTQRVWLHSTGDLKTISLSFVQVGEDSYLSGLRLSGEDGKDVQIGYRAPAEQIFDLNFKTLAGMQLAIGPRGIHGLRFVTDGGSDCSRWYGRQDDLPRTDCLVSGKPVAALEFGLDACKIVRVAIARDTSHGTPENTVGGYNYQQSRHRQLAAT